jgi:alpha-methylacyl-CoA racemase
MLMAFGVLCGIHEAQRSGLGQVIDASMVDGVALLSTSIWDMRARGLHTGPPGTNMFDSGAPFFDTYETADGRYIALGPVESKFNSELCARIGIEDVPADRHHAEETWPARKAELARVFRKRTRDEWADLLEHTDACATPVLSFDEAPEHAHNLARGTFVRHDGVIQPAPAPRFERTPGAIQSGPATAGAHTDEILREWLGANDEEIEKLLTLNAIA